MGRRAAAASRGPGGTANGVRGPIAVLLVEDNPDDASLCRAHLQDVDGREPVALTVAATLARALELLPGEFDLVLLDLHLPDARGLPALHRVLAACDRPVVVLTGLDDDACARACVEAGAQDYVHKNAMDARALRRAIDFARARTRAHARRRVLLVDDDELLLRALSRLLRRHHDVVPAQGGAAALAKLRAGERFDVVLCDLMMAGMDGVETLAAVRAEFPALADRFIVLTGGAATPRTCDFLARADVPVVSKPVTLETLLRAVDERLAAQ